MNECFAEKNKRRKKYHTRYPNRKGKKLLFQYKKNFYISLHIFFFSFLLSFYFHQTHVSLQVKMFRLFYLDSTMRAQGKVQWIESQKSNKKQGAESPEYHFILEFFSSVTLFTSFRARLDTFAVQKSK